ncbi:ABC-type amino acid transport substrate-binding protein [Duganella sp. CF402]|uniref:substrate-binding periplasmic protein n=1 Tax=unclassified Duganella TaxID=2636909 RepID=UPI0008D3377C|nr:MULTISPECIES: transporter substrate-binding domain-containing protein [unclassified Duganella]RZT04147.1 ABC-type amino acid transport substrate-binding protein [Duganella sp. BK701]SEM46471.1 ABC-type amino acid transport substrate-binding protein [Duganella sp. CF402]
MPVRPSHALAALFICCTAQAQGPDTLIFGTTHERASSAYGYAAEYLQNLCVEIHQRCQLQSLPGRRGAAMLADGSIVGELGRVKEYKELHPEYQRVEEPFIILRTYMFTRANRPEINSWEEVESKLLTVSYQRGVYYYQKRLEALKPAVKPHDVQTVAACLQMVLNGRDQACVFDDGALGPEARALLPQGRLGKPLNELSLHIYLGKDYAVMAPAISEAVRRLNAQGLRARLHKKYFISP